MQGNSPKGIGNMVSSCLILHNMGTVNERYVASTDADPEYGNDIVDDNIS
jgi:hypothetical protein